MAEGSNKRDIRLESSYWEGTGSSGTQGEPRGGGAPFSRLPACLHRALRGSGVSHPAWVAHALPGFAVFFLSSEGLDSSGSKAAYLVENQKVLFASFPRVWVAGHPEVFLRPTFPRASTWSCGHALESSKHHLSCSIPTVRKSPILRFFVLLCKIVVLSIKPLFMNGFWCLAWIVG